MRHAQDVRAGFGIAELGGPRELVERFAFAFENFGGGAAYLFGQRAGVIGQRDLTAAQRQHVAHARRHFDAVHRLGQEVVGAGFQRPVTHFPFMVRGDHEQGRLAARRVGAEPADELYAIHVRHHVIDDHQIRILVQAVMQRFGWRQETGRGYVRQLGEQGGHEGEVDLGIVDHDNIHAGHSVCVW